MPSDSEHRKHVRHFNESGSCHELTFSCYGRLQLLDDDWRLLLLSRQLGSALETCGFNLVAFVFMPEHVHVLVYGNRPGTDVSRLLKAIKRPFSYQVKCRLIDECSPLLKELTVRENGIEMFRFWQAGPGYDRNLHTTQAVLASLNYIHMNPVRRQLVGEAEDWKWSSAGHYVLGSTDKDLPKIDDLPAHFFF